MEVLACGSLLMLGSLTQAATRAGFDLQRRAVSMLSLGEIGWTQVLNFVVCGALIVARATGVRRASHPGRANLGASHAWRVWRGLDHRRAVHHESGARFPARNSGWNADRPQLAHVLLSSDLLCEEGKRCRAAILLTANHKRRVEPEKVIEAITEAPARGLGE
jgi:hypothetical protein